MSLPDPSARRLLVELLGPLRVTLDGEPAGLKGPMQCGLFVRLVLAQGEAVGFDSLMEDLWPGRDPGSARRNLQTQIHALRIALGRERIETVGARAYRLELKAHELDAVLADDALHRARSLAEVDREAALQVLGEAIDRFRGPPLIEFASHDWARFDAVRLEQLREDLTSLQILQRLETGDYASLIPKLRVLTENHPENERYWSALMTALYRDGRQQEALNAFQDARRRMAQQFGLEPSPELQALEHQILEHAQALRPRTEPPAPTSLRGCSCWVDENATDLVGRDDDLYQLDHAVTGGARLVLVSGEPGVGKTRLVMDYARRNGHRRIFYGTCDESSGRSFSPIADIVEHVDSDNPGLLQHLDAHASVDALRRLIGLDQAGAHPESSRSALLAALGALFAHLTDEHPPILVIDQLSQADVDSLEVLARLIGPLATSSVVVIGITQPAALAPSARVAGWLHALPQQVQVREVRLSPLGEAAVGELAERLGHDGLDPARLLRESGGNPMLLEHLVINGGDGDASSVARLAWRRISNCSPQAVALLKAAAIDGLRPRGWLTVELSGLSPDEAADALSEVIADGLLRQVTDPGTSGRYAFVHGLIRSVLLVEIGPEHRCALHRKAAELLVQRRSGGDLVRPGDIARHYLAAAPSVGRGPAIEWLTESATSAERNSAYDRASTELDAALGLVSGDADDDELAAELLIERGRVLSTYIHQGEGRKLLERAIERARRAGRADLVATAAMEVGGVLAMGDTTDPTVAELLEDALEGLGTGHPHLRAEVLARLAQLHYMEGPTTERVAMCDEAERLAADAPAEVRARIGINRYWACDLDADPVVTWSLIERTGALAAEAGDRLLALQVLKCRLHSTIAGGDLEAADDVAARFAASAAEVGSADMVRLDRLYGAMRAGSRGDYELAGRLADESRQLLAETGRTEHAMAVDGLVRLPWLTMTNDHDTAEAIITLLSMSVKPGPMWTIFNAWFRARAGEVDAAREVAKDFDLDAFIEEEQRQNSGLIASTAIATARLIDRPEWAAPLAAWFGVNPGASVHLGQTMFLGYHGHYLGMAEAMRGPKRVEAAIDALTAAADRSRRAGATPWRLFAEVHLARLGVGPDGAGDADPAGLAAEAERLGFHWIAEDARSMI
ncbi:MAG: BTAD domain-containing putative transcriptional regulator [Microthrixaceae bacterium]